jgi:hypothetical protein
MKKIKNTSFATNCECTLKELSFVVSLWALVVAGAIVLAFPQQVSAARYPDCGEVDRGLVKDVYVAARQVDYLVDVLGNVDSFCSAVENLDQWEKDLPREARNNEYKKARQTIIKNAEGDLRNLKGRLISLRVWVSYGSYDAADEVLRRARIKNAVKKLLAAVRLLEQNNGQIQLLMQERAD